MEENVGRWRMWFDLAVWFFVRFCLFFGKACSFSQPQTPIKIARQTSRVRRSPVRSNQCRADGNACPRPRCATMSLDRVGCLCHRKRCAPCTREPRRPPAPPPKGLPIRARSEVDGPATATASVRTEALVFRHLCFLPACFPASIDDRRDVVFGGGHCCGHKYATIE